MEDWHATYLGRRRIPRDLTAFELEAFFSFTAAECSAIRVRRDSSELHLGLALQVGFLRMSGRQLDKVGVVPPLLWKHLGAQLGVAAPEVASLRAIYRRRQTLFEHQEAARSLLGFRWTGDALREECFPHDLRATGRNGKLAAPKQTGALDGRPALMVLL